VTTTTESKFIPILERVRNLMARAEHPDTPTPEAEVALREANKLMTRHAIDEAVLASHQTKAERRRPVVEKWHWMETRSEHSAYLRTMLAAIARANRCRVVISFREPYEATIVGMAEDAAWVQTLYTNCYLTFLSKLNPKWDLDDFDGSVYRYKVAGFTWIEAWWALVDAKGLRGEVRYDHYRKNSWRLPSTLESDLEKYKELGLPRPPVDGKTSTFIAAYRRHAAKIGDTDLISTQHTTAYRRSFAKGFADQIEIRLWRMRKDTAEEVARAGAELVLVGLEEAVADAFYEEFPTLHPDEVKKRELISEQNSIEAQRRAAEIEDLKLAAMTPSARRRYIEAKERKERRDREANERYWAREDKRITYVSAGSRAGREAANGVALTRATAVDADNTSAIGAG
jgi:hypothetical protein